MSVTIDLEGFLSKKSLYRDGMDIFRLGDLAVAFRRAVEEHVGRLSTNLEGVALENLHLAAPIADQIPSAHNMNKFSIRISDKTPALNDLYHRLIKTLAAEYFEEDLIFEARPQLRFHFPVKAPDRFRRRDGELACFHSDIMLGDFFEQTNCWLPITNCFGSNSLQIANLSNSVDLLNEYSKTLDGLEDFYRSRNKFFEYMRENDDFYGKAKGFARPFKAAEGELLLFDPRCIHGTAENSENSTRVSVDFRVIPVKAYNAAVQQRSLCGSPNLEYEGEKLARNGYFHKYSSSELFLEH